MGRRTSYIPGTFSWAELATTDPAGAKTFYGALFGWDAEDAPMPEGGGTYTTAKIDGEAVAGLAEQREEQRSAGVPPNWLSYITVADADSAAARVKDLGGAVHAGPFDVGELGRMAVIADPTGAIFGIWEARGSIGATLVNDPGALTSNELATNDVERASEFYSALFGWDISPVDTQGGPPYWTIAHDGAVRGLNGGIRELMADEVAAGVPPNWIPYFTCSSTDGTVETAKQSAGGVLAGPIDIPPGRIAMLRDPHGAVFGIFEGEVDD